MTMLEIVTSVFAIVLRNRASVQAALEAIAKRAAKKGLPVPAWSWGAVTTEDETHMVRHAEYPEEIVPRTFKVTRIALTLSAAPLRFAGWRFLAEVSHLGADGNLVLTVPGEVCPPKYRTAASDCDHCKHDRRRNTTYILRHEDGRIVQVGSTCIEDFLGGGQALSVCGAAEIAARIGKLCDMGASDIGFGAGSAGEIGLESFLMCVAYDVQKHGWVSRGKAREDYTGQTTATADAVWRSYDKLRTKVEPGSLVGGYSDEEDSIRIVKARTTGAAALAWAADLSDETLSKERSDYLSNVRTVARTGYVTHKTAGIAASIVTAWERAEGAARLAADRAARPSCNAFLGAIGDKMSFGLAPQVGKRGAPLKSAPKVASLDPLTLDFVSGFDGAYGYTTIAKFRTSEGHTVVWFASGAEFSRADVGKRYTLTGSVKKHDTYKGTNQTTLTRCTYTCLDVPAADGTDVSEAAQ